MKKENEALDNQLQEAEKMHQISAQQRDIKRKELEEFKAKHGQKIEGNV